MLRHSAAHVMAEAVKDLFPMAKFGIGPAIEDGFYYDFAIDRPFTPEDLEAIEARMAQIIAEELPFKRAEIDKLEACDEFEQQDLKLELIAELPESETISIYHQGAFTDLCRGPHVPDTGRIGAFKLTKIAGAYWRGDNERPMLQRIYGTAWFTQKDLDAYLDAPRRGREARPPQARQGARSLQLPRGRRRGPAALPPQGRARAAPDAGVAARRALRARLRRGHHAAHLQDRRLEDQRALRLLPREHVLLQDRRGRRQGQRVRASSR